MKHNTHIYIAAKSIEMLYEGLGNIRNLNNNPLKGKVKSDLQRSGKVLQRMLSNYKESIKEASWAPDDILNDKALYHTFKLFTDKEFPDSKKFAKEIHCEKYYRTSGGGGLPYKVDHLARVISDMSKLREYNDRCSMNQIMYYFFLLSHYIVDAHVPMHCDLRDDPPSKTDKSKPQNGKYFPESFHGKIEELWEEAVIPAAINERIIEKQRQEDAHTGNSLNQFVIFDVTNKAHCKEIIPYAIEKDLMKFMIDICIRSKNRSLELFPGDNPLNYDETKFKKATREIFAESISNLISVWIWIWHKKDNVKE